MRTLVQKLREKLPPVRTMYRKRKAAKRFEAIRHPDAYAPGSELWLQATEKHFGGFVSGVTRTKLSPHAATLPAGGMIGGDRMFHHGYAPAYAKHLAGLIPRRYEPITIVEVGILMGSGLALWSTLFPAGRIIGLDIDPSNFRSNEKALRAKGAFATNSVEAHEFDQFLDNTNLLANVLGADKITVMIDDGNHSPEAIFATLRSAQHHLARSFVYFVEDNANVFGAIKAAVPDCRVVSYGELTVIER